MNSRNPFPMNNWDTHEDQTHEDLLWGGQVDACVRKAKSPKDKRDAADGLPGLDPNGTGCNGYSPRDDLR